MSPPWDIAGNDRQTAVADSQLFRSANMARKGTPQPERSLRRSGEEGLDPETIHVFEYRTPVRYPIIFVR
jgi:hypothetical protein